MTSPEARDRSSLYDLLNGMRSRTLVANFSTSIFGISVTNTTTHAMANVNLGPLGLQSAVVINSNGGFFTWKAAGWAQGSNPLVSGLVGGTQRARGFVLLHEFAHALRPLPFEQNDRYAQAFNNDLLARNCAKALSSLGN